MTTSFPLEFKLFDFNVFSENDDFDSGSGSGSGRGYIVRRDTHKFIIQMFGIDKSGKSVSICVRDFKPFFYVMVNDEWTINTKNIFHQHLKEKVGKYYENSISSCKIIKRQKLYGFDGGKEHKFVRIDFENIEVFNKCKSLWYGPYVSTGGKNGRSDRKLLPNGYDFMGTCTKLYEANIPPLLRFFHIQEISPSGWIQLLPNKYVELTDSEKKTNCNYEYIVSHFKNIQPLPDKEDSVPYKICSFDIEASSSHGDFPVPVKSYKKLASQMIEYFEKLKKNKTQNQNQNQIQYKELLENMIYVAFDFVVEQESELSQSLTQYIDMVYPKVKPSLPALKVAIEKWLECSMNASVATTEHKDIMTIEESFSKIHQNEEADTAESYSASSSYSANSYYKKNKTKSKTILDILTEDTFTRDEKMDNLVLSLNAHFPKLEGDKVTFIGSTFLKYGENKPYKNHCIVLNSCAEMPGTEIESYSTEREVLLAWQRLIERENPDIIVGYNIFGFDYEFMFRRAEENKCEERFLALSRNKDEICATQNRDTMRYKIEESSIQIASGQHDLNFIKMNGRLQIDLYNYFRREENLSSYKLDYVAGHFIGDYIKAIEVVDSPTNLTLTTPIKTKIYTSNLTGLLEESYVHIEEIGHTVEYYADGAKFKVLDVNRTDKDKWFTIDGEITPDMKNKKVRWCLAKDDVTPKDIFRMTNGTSTDRAVIAKYCIQDCNLVHYLANKVDVLTSFIEMSRICSVPMNYLVMRGQGIKLTSYIAKKCREKRTLMPVIEKGNTDEGYEGAIVLEPKCDLYLDNPVACVDYASLYPSSMISENLSHDSKVWTREYDLAGNLIAETGEKDKDGIFIYDNLPGYEYVDVTYDTYSYVRKSASSAAEKVKSGNKICRFAQFPHGTRAIMPSILMELLSARKSTRKQIPLQTDEFMKNVLDKRQLGYKLTANSLYGQCGAKTSTFYEKDVAAATTATGRLLLTYAKKVIEECYGDAVCETTKHGPVCTKAEYIYGDSVASYTPVYIKIGNKIEILPIDELADKYGGGKWRTCEEPGKQEKEVCVLHVTSQKEGEEENEGEKGGKRETKDIMTWTDKGWTKLECIIRHALSDEKKMLRVITSNGVVDVTDDHSLLKSDGTEISPKNIYVPRDYEYYSQQRSNQQHHSEVELLHSPIEINEQLYEDEFCSELGFTNIKMADISKMKSVFHSCIYEVRKDMFCKWLELNYNITDVTYKTSPLKLKIKAKNQRVMARIYLVATKLLKLEVRLFASKQHTLLTVIDPDDEDVLQLIPGNSFSFPFYNNKNKETRVDTDKTRYFIKNMFQIPYSGFVYDLTTENHHFAAGVGDIIVHNTDSVFFTFYLQDPNGEQIRGKKALEITIELAQQAGHLASSFLKAPHDLEYEKTFMPFCLLSKKRYVGMLYETDPNKCKRKEMGIVLKRRDNAPIVKDIYGGIIDILMKEQNIQKAIDFLKSCLQNIVDEKFPMEKLIITKSLRSAYKNPQQIAHKVLADRITARDPGNKPSSGDRIPFVYIHNTNKTALQGEKIETPSFILENRLKIDYSFYITNQIMKPVQQLFALVLEKIWMMQNKKGKLMKFKKEVEELMKKTDEEKFGDKLEQLKNKEVKALLFDEYLRQTNNTKSGNQVLTDFFTKTKKQ